jgi:RNA polymerase subunit RPABC4/transcription elongation factor Spt4
MSTTLARCESCGALVDAEDLFCANCGTEVPDAHPADQGRVATQAKNFACKGCGATMNYDAAAQSLKCPFCGSVDLVEEASKGVLAPERVVPFAIDQAGAENRLRAWLGSSFWHPNDLRSTAQLTELKAVFVPFWITSSNVRTYWTADSSQTPPGARGNWFPLNGRWESSYEDLWVPAGGAIHPSELNAILPFNLSAGVEPENVDLVSITVEQFSISRRYSRPLVQSLLEGLEAETVRRQVPGNSRNIHVNVLMEDAESRPVLAPVYVMAYRYRDRVFRSLVNGQDGRAYGYAPFSMGKLLTILGIILAIVLLIAFFALR